jgi:hypothetical protein
LRVVTGRSTFIAAVALLFGAAPASAATYTVTGSVDPPGASCNGQNVCTSLRAAVAAANGNSGSTIQLGPGTFLLGNPGDLPGAGGLGINVPVTITGAGQGGASGTTIAQTDGNSRVVSIANSGGTGAIQISNLEITGGHPGSVIGDDEQGGAVFISSGAAVGLTDVTVTGNTARGADVTGVSQGGGIADGGGIFSLGDLTLTNSTITGNHAIGGASPNGVSGYALGGGIYSENGTLTINGSTITHNDATAGSGAPSGSGNAGEGGGVYAFNAMTIQNSTVSDNAANSGAGGEPSCDASGGGIQGTVVTLSSVTVSDNAATGGPGAASNGGCGAEGGGVSASGDMTVSRSSITGNTATGGSAASTAGPGAAGGFGRGGGLADNATTGHLSLLFTTISGNHAIAGAGGHGATNGNGGAARGGGVMIDGATTAASTIDSSTIDANTATGGASSGSGSAAGDATGGGVSDGTPKTTVATVLNSTITGNTVTAGDDSAGGTAGAAEGGGADSRPGSIALTSSTVAANTAAGTGGLGGNIADGGHVGLSDTIVAAGVAAGGGGHVNNCVLLGPDTGVDVGHNVEDSGSTSQCLLGAAANALAAPGAAGLGALSANGGFTETIALTAGSPAIGAGGTCTVTVDQREKPRGTPCDIGAFEGQKPTITSPPQLTGQPLVNLSVTCSSGSWKGDGTFTYAYQWLRNGAPIAGATKPVYTLQRADGGQLLSCQVTATGPFGSGSATSVKDQVSIPGKLAFPRRQTDTLKKGGRVFVRLTCSKAGPCAGVLQVHVFLRHGKVVAKKGKHTVERLIGFKQFTAIAGFRGSVGPIKLTNRGRSLVLRSRRGIPVALGVASVHGRATIVKPAKRRRHG